MGKVSRYILVGLAILVTISGYGISMSLYGRTIINPWIPVLAALAVAVATGLHLWKAWRPLTGMDGRIVNSLCHIVTASSVVMAAFYVCNYTLADKSSAHGESAVVESRYAETHYRNKRVGRRSYGRGEPYKVYCIEVRLADGRTKKLSMPLSRYNRIHTGDTLTLPMAKGALGVPVILHD